MPSFCTKCGYQNADLSAFCESCGKPLAARHGTIPSSLAVIAVDDTIDPKANIGAGSPAEGSESSEQWECRTCKALNQQDNDTCWNCQRTKASPAVKLVDDALKSPFLDRLTTQVLAIIGGLMFLFGLIRFNSLGSQMVRGLGRSRMAQRAGGRLHRLIFRPTSWAASGPSPSRRRGFDPPNAWFLASQPHQQRICCQRICLLHHRNGRNIICT